MRLAIADPHAVLCDQTLYSCSAFGDLGPGLEAEARLRLLRVARFVCLWCAPGSLR